MATAIRKHFRDFLAVAALLILGLVVSYYIVQKQRLRIPILEEKPFQLKAEFATAQAVTPGQGQTVVVAGVRIGDITKVELEDGVAVVTMDIDREFLPIYEDATALVRPRTGLQDMFVELDPGSADAGEFDDGDRISLENTQTQVNLDEVLEALDGDTQAYLRALFIGGGQGLEGRARDLGEVLGTLGPINEKLARLNRLVAQRRQNLANVIHDLDTLSEEIGDNGNTLAALVDSSNAALGAIAQEDLNVRQTIAELPSTLRTARVALGQLEPYAALLGPTFNNLRPFARNLDDMNASVRAVADTFPVIRDEIRPFVRSAREPISDLRPAARRLARTTPRLTDLAYVLNRLGNMAAYNPRGANPPGAANRDEGYLYWAGWLGHNGNSVFQTADGTGLYRRIYLTASCQTLLSILASSPLAPIVTPFQQLFPPSPGSVCP